MTMDQGEGNRRPTDGIAQPPADLSVALAGMAARGAAALAGLIKALAPEPVKGDAQA